MFHPLPAADRIRKRARTFAGPFRLTGRFGIAALALLVQPLLASPLLAEGPPQSYAEKLMEDARTRHPELALLVLHTNAPAGKGTTYTAGTAEDDRDKSLATAGATGAVNAAGTLYRAELPLQDVAGAQVGTLLVGLRYRAGDDTARLQALAETVRHELRRRTTNAANLTEPFPYDASVSNSTYAQHLVDATMEAHPELLILAIHVARPNETTSIILGSNIGRIGKKDTEDDMQVLRTGKPYLEIKAPGDRYEDILTLQDGSGSTIGTVAILLPFSAGGDAQRAQRQAEAIRDEMSRKIPSKAALFKVTAVGKPG